MSPSYNRNGHANGSGGLDLTGAGAAYVRVSDDEQDTERQHAAVRAFLKRHGASVADGRWFADEGWARDKAAVRPAFNRLLGLAEAGKVRWIVVAERDRFGTTDADEFVHYRYLLRRWGCRLYDVAGTEWTRKDTATVIIAAFEGDKSEKEQHDTSHRVLSGKAGYARDGQWQGGPVRLGFDVACYPKETGTQKPNSELNELWRVVVEGRDKRLKVYPDGRDPESFDGPNNFPLFNPKTEMLRLTPSIDQAKVGVAVSVFERYANESINLTALAHWLNRHGWRNGWGGHFTGQHVEDLLSDPIYLGYYTWNKNHHGKFHRFTDGQAVPELNYKEKVSPNKRADWVQSHRLFEPLVDRGTWARVEQKLEGRERRTPAPRSVALYLAGLVYCANCGCRMVAGPHRKEVKRPRKDGHTGVRFEYVCGTYQKAVREKWRRDCKCLRNGVFQDELERYIDRYLEETGHRLELFTRGAGVAPDAPTDRLQGQEGTTWKAFLDGFQRVTEYLAQHHPDDYTALLAEDARVAAEDERAMMGDADGADGPPAPGRYARLTDIPGFREAAERGREALDRATRRGKGETTDVQPGDEALGMPDFIAACLSLYRAHFDPEGLRAEIEREDAELAELTEGWRDLPKIPLVRQQAEKRMAEKAKRIEELRAQQQDDSAVLAAQWREINDLQLAVADAKLAMRSEAGERALRVRAEKLRAVIERIECTFTATGKTGSGWGMKNSELAMVAIYPVAGDPRYFSVDRESILLWTRATSPM